MTGSTQAEDGNDESVVKRSAEITAEVSVHLHMNALDRLVVSLTDFDTLRREILYEGYERDEADDVFDKIVAGELECSVQIQDTFPDVSYPNDAESTEGVWA